MQQHYLSMVVVVAGLVLVARAWGEEGWRADAKMVEAAVKGRAGVIYEEAKVPKYVLPEALVCGDGTRVTTKEQWESRRRGETLELFAKHVYGRTPGRPAKVTFEVLASDAKAMEGKATLTRVKIVSSDAGGKLFGFEAAVLVPNGLSSPAPCFLLINNRALTSADPTRKDKNDFWPAEAIIGRGYAAAVFGTNDVDPDKKGEEARAQGVRGVWPAGGGEAGKDAWGTIGAWAWGASRVLDFLETAPGVDAKRVAVIGHSRGGKTALWAGAQDTRFALTISNDSGCGGAALSRRRFGETVERINTAFPYWFCENFKAYNGKEDQLPVDQHQLMALIAPRALAVGSADADLWADQRGEFLSLAHAGPVYALYGLAGVKADEMPPLDKPLLRGNVSYHIRRGGHGLTPFDWEQYMNLGDRVWRGK